VPVGTLACDEPAPGDSGPSREGAVTQAVPQDALARAGGRRRPRLARLIRLPGSPGAPGLLFAVRPGLSRRQGWWLLTLWMVMWGAWAARAGGYSWHYFQDGAWLPTHPEVAGAGLHLYATHPQLQIGPLALLAAIPGQWLPPEISRLLAEAGLAVLGLAMLRTLERTRAHLTGRPVPMPLLLGVGAVMIPIWGQVATHYTHLDDALAMGFAVLALRALVARRPLLLALALAAAADAKPWALGFAVLLVALPVERRRRAALVTAAAVAAVWLPFVIADPQTLLIGRFTIDTATDSALRALGVNDPATPPWDRPAQVILGAVIGLLAVRRGRWPLVPLAVVAARMLLDPQTYPYYSSGLLIAAAAADLLHRRRVLPVWTLALAAWVSLDAVTSSALPPAVHSVARAVVCLTTLLAIGWPTGDTPSSEPTRRRLGHFSRDVTATPSDASRGSHRHELRRLNTAPAKQPMTGYRSIDHDNVGEPA